MRFLQTTIKSVLSVTGRNNSNMYKSGFRNNAVLTSKRGYFGFERGSLSAYNRPESVADVDENTHSQFKCRAGCKHPHHHHL
ncbi:hypothetical protein BC833DRAFT_617804 [Globomyces pollinis-pini]|nr:hypothetical protein BC833DRAFT_617804 [Globomyces pollinis-pini]